MQAKLGSEHQAAQQRNEQLLAAIQQLGASPRSGGPTQEQMQVRSPVWCPRHTNCAAICTCHLARPIGTFCFSSGRRKRWLPSLFSHPHLLPSHIRLPFCCFTSSRPQRCSSANQPSPAHLARRISTSCRWYWHAADQDAVLSAGHGADSGVPVSGPTQLPGLVPPCSTPAGQGQVRMHILHAPLHACIAAHAASRQASPGLCIDTMCVMFAWRVHKHPPLSLPCCSIRLHPPYAKGFMSCPVALESACTRIC